MWRLNCCTVGNAKVVLFSVEGAMVRSKDWIILVDGHELLQIQSRYPKADMADAIAQGLLYPLFVFCNHVASLIIGINKEWEGGEWPPVLACLQRACQMYRRGKDRGRMSTGV